VDTEGAACPSGSVQVTDQAECAGAATTYLIRQGMLKRWQGIGTWADHVPFCFATFYTSAKNNGNVHFGTNPAVTGSRGYRICKPAPYFQLDTEGAACPSGSVQVTDQAECAGAATTYLVSQGQVRRWYNSGTWADHVPFCFEGSGYWSGGTGNGNVHFGTNPAVTGSRGYRICRRVRTFVQYGCCKNSEGCNFWSTGSRVGDVGTASQGYAATFGACNDKCKAAGYVVGDFFGMECPMQGLTLCQCYRSSSLYSVSSDFLTPHTEDCSANQVHCNNSPYLEHDGTTYQLGGANVGSVYMIQ